MYHTVEPRRQVQLFMFPDKTFCYGMLAEGAGFTISGDWKITQRNSNKALVIQLQGKSLDLPLFGISTMSDIPQEEAFILKHSRWLVTDTSNQEWASLAGIRLAVNANGGIPAATAFQKITPPKDNKVPDSIVTELPENARYLFVLLPEQINGDDIFPLSYQNKLYRFDFGTESRAVLLGIRHELLVQAKMNEMYQADAIFDLDTQTITVQQQELGSPKIWEDDWRKVQQQCMPLTNQKMPV